MKPLPEAVRRFLSESPVCRISTVRSNGDPHVIPVCPVFDGESTVYVDLGSASASAEGFRVHGRVAALFDVYGDDWSQLKAVLLHCRAAEIDADERDRAWEMIRAKFPQYTTVNWEPRFTVALRIEDWREWGLLDGSV